MKTEFIAKLITNNVVRMGENGRLSPHHPPKYAIICKLSQNEMQYGMHIITRKRIQAFIAKYPDSEPSLENWYRIVRRTEYDSFSELKEHFRSADYVDGFVVFNISGNKYRLIAAIHFDRKKIYIRHILTHPQYDKGQWKRE